MKILLVDDESFALKLMTRLLEVLGCSDILSFERAHEALAILGADVGAVDLVICDLQMPEKDGVEFVRHLAQLGYAGGLILAGGGGGRGGRAAGGRAGARRRGGRGGRRK